MLPNYGNYWKEAGYVGEIEATVAAGEAAKIPSLLTDEWLTDTTLFGPASRVREELEKWFDAGVKTPILVPSSVSGGQMKAFEELFKIF